VAEKVKELNEIWGSGVLAASDAAMGTAVTRAKYYCQKVKDSWQTLHKDKTNRILSMNEEQLHQLEKIKIENNCKKLSSLLCSVCYKCLDDVTEKLEDWYTVAQVAIVQSEEYFKELALFIRDCDQMQHCLRGIKEQAARIWKSHLELNGKYESNHKNGVSVIPDLEELSSVFLSCSDGTSCLPPQLLNEVKRLREARGRLWYALEENNAVISEFESLSTDCTPTSQ
jgi:hypothetical protein